MSWIESVTGSLLYGGSILHGTSNAHSPPPMTLASATGPGSRGGKLVGSIAVSPRIGEGSGVGVGSETSWADRSTADANASAPFWTAVSPSPGASAAYAANCSATAPKES